MSIAGFFGWFSNHGRYCTLFQCMAYDRAWVVLTVSLDLLVAAGYVLIARHWWINARTLADSPSKRALASMRNIFVFCGLCGYLFIPIKMFWPAWRLYDLFMVALVYFTWKYALRSRNLKVLYADLGRSAELARELAATRAQAKQQSFFLNSISHDLRTPLNGLMLQTELAAVGIETQDMAAIADALKEIKASAKATAALLDQFREIGRLDWLEENNNYSTFNVDELLACVVETSRNVAAQGGLFLRMSVPRELRVRTDRSKLERVLLNLVQNAIKFTPTGGVELTAAVRGRRLRRGGRHGDRSRSGRPGADLP